MYSPNFIMQHEIAQRIVKMLVKLFVYLRNDIRANKECPHVGGNPFITESPGMGFERSRTLRNTNSQAETFF